MSRIGNLLIKMPAGVKVSQSSDKLTVEGAKGKLNLDLVPEIKVNVENNQIKLVRTDDSKKSKSMHGLFRVLVSNMVNGVTTGFEKRLEINGTGFKAAVQGNKLVLNIGFSHPIEYIIPEGVKIAVEENTKLVISGINKQMVGEAAAVIRRFRPPEPYKAKGIKYNNEVVRRKAGKAAKK